jgi:hypothetical protein
MAREIGEEDERAFQHADQVDSVRMIATDLLRQLPHALLNVVCRNEDVHREVPYYKRRF